MDSADKRYEGDRRLDVLAQQNARKIMKSERELVNERN